MGFGFASRRAKKNLPYPAPLKGYKREPLHDFVHVISCPDMSLDGLIGIIVIIHLKFLLAIDSEKINH